MLDMVIRITATTTAINKEFKFGLVCEVWRPWHLPGLLYFLGITQIGE
jgi:hypothetical protein